MWYVFSDVCNFLYGVLFWYIMCAVVGIIRYFFVWSLMGCDYCLLVGLMDLGVVPYALCFLFILFWDEWKTRKPWLEGLCGGFHISIVGIYNEVWRLCCTQTDKCWQDQSQKFQNWSLWVYDVKESVPLDIIFI